MRDAKWTGRRYRASLSEEELRTLLKACKETHGRWAELPDEESTAFCRQLSELHECFQMALGEELEPLEDLEDSGA